MTRMQSLRGISLHQNAPGAFASESHAPSEHGAGWAVAGVTASAVWLPVGDSTHTRTLRFTTQCTHESHFCWFVRCWHGCRTLLATRVCPAHRRRFNRAAGRQVRHPYRPSKSQDLPLCGMAAVFSRLWLHLRDGLQCCIQRRLAAVCRVRGALFWPAAPPCAPPRAESSNTQSGTSSSHSGVQRRAARPIVAAQAPWVLRISAAG